MSGMQRFHSCRHCIYSDSRMLQSTMKVVKIRKSIRNVWGTREGKGEKLMNSERCYGLPPFWLSNSFLFCSLFYLIHILSNSCFLLFEQSLILESAHKQVALYTSRYFLCCSSWVKCFSFSVLRSAFLGK